MTRNETKQLLMRISSVYPNWKPQADLQFVTDTWWEYFADYEYEEMKTALKTYIATDTSGFAPSIGQLIDKLHTFTTQVELNEMEAWALVSKALRNGSYNAEQEFEKLPPLVQKAVGLPGQLRIWALDEDYSEAVTRSNFIKTYRQEVAKSRELWKIPKETRSALEQFQNMELETTKIAAMG